MSETRGSHSINELLRRIGNQPGISDPFAAAIIQGMLKEVVEEEQEWDTKENK